MMDTELQSNSSTQAVAKEAVEDVEAVGETLKSARLAAGLSVRDVAEKLRLLSSQVNALETGDYSQFRSDFFSKGFLRSYAKMLDLDDESIIDRYRKSLPVQAQTKKQSSSFAHVQNPIKGRSIRYWFLFAAIIIAFLLWKLSGVEEVATASGLTTDSVVVDSRDRSLISELETSSSDSKTGSNTGLIVNEPSEEVVDTSGLTPGQDIVVEAVTERENLFSTEKVIALATESSQEEPVGSENSLVFSFTKDCWVEVKNRNNEIIFSDIKRADETLSLDGAAPFEIVLGYAPGVILEYNGEAVSIISDGKNNFARLTVGKS